MRAITGACTDGTEVWSIELRTEEPDIDLIVHAVAAMFVVTESPHHDWSEWRVELFDSSGDQIHSAAFPQAILKRGQELRGRPEQRGWTRTARKGPAGQLH